MLRKRITWLLAFTFLGILAIAWSEDYRKVKLVYVGRATITPGTGELIGEPLHAFFTWGGKDLKRYVENDLFPECYTYVMKQVNGRESIVRQWKAGKQYRINWNKLDSFEDQAVYYVGLGCEIKKVTYFYHTKYTNYLNDPSVFTSHSTALRPIDDNTIVIYKGDVAAVGP